MEATLVLFALLFVTLIPACCTVGMALLLRLWMSRRGRWSRTWLAALLGPFVSIGLLAVLVMLSESYDSTEILIAVGLFAGLVALVGFPVAFLATRKLDSLLAHFPSDIFE